MFESCYSLTVTNWGNLICEKVDDSYIDCWSKIKKNFTGAAKQD